MTRARIRQYPHGDLEVTVVRRPPATQLRKVHGRQRADTDQCRRTLIEQVEDYARSATRAQSTVRRLIQAACLDHMLTLTYRENRIDARQCDADLTRFLRLVRDNLQSDYPYVAVFERQKRGAGHWHLAVAGRQNVSLLRTLWRKVVGEGNIDVRSWSGRGRSGECSARLAGYLSKYISKDINQRPETPHRYRRSRNIVVQETVEEFEDADLDHVASDVFTRLINSNPRFILRGDAGGQCFLWACSWGGSPGKTQRMEIQRVSTPPSGSTLNNRAPA
jgi:hypothetical protein